MASADVKDWLVATLALPRPRGVFAPPVSRSPVRAVRDTGEMARISA
jgi:hypothetical protein